VVVICTCQTLSDEIHTLRRWDDSRKKYPLLILRNLHISEHVVLHHFALPRFNNDSDKRSHLMSTTCHISRTCGISNRSRSLSLSLSLSTHLYLQNAAPHTSCTPHSIPCPLKYYRSPSLSAQSPLHPRLLGRYTTRPPALQPFRLASIASEQADFACYCGALWIRHLWREHYEMCNRCVVMCPTEL
jgi:hypothetical protein